MTSTNKFTKRVNKFNRKHKSKLERKIIMDDDKDLPTETRVSVLMASILGINNNLRGSFTQQVRNHETIETAIEKLRLRLSYIKAHDAITALGKFSIIIKVHKGLIQRHFTESMRTHKLLSNELKNVVSVIYGKERIEAAEKKTIKQLKEELKNE